MSVETRQCQNCRENFSVAPEDISFYKKISVPLPTWCPECRFMRRLSWRNVWHLFKKTDARTGEKIFSLFPEESPVPVYEKDFWYSDGWDPMEYGRDYDWNRPFFEQFRDFMRVVPVPAHSVLNLSNCQYCTNANDLKNCYLVRASTGTEDSAYLIWDRGSKMCMDSHMTVQCELSYGNTNVERSYKALFCVDCEDSSDIILCKDCIGCTSCFGSIGLRNKSYCFFNEQLSKEEYEKRLESYSVGSYDGLQSARADAWKHWRSFPHRHIHGRQNVDSSGDYISESKNTKHCFRVRECEDVKFSQNLLKGTSRDCYDYSNFGQGAELMYESLICGLGVSHIKFCAQCFSNNRNLEYCMFSQRSAYLFGCIGVRDKQYCIFNKQYDKDTYFALRDKIITHMNEMPYTDSAGRIYAYGEFFPPELSPIPYHITEAHEFFPLSGREAQERGFSWYELKQERHTGTYSVSDIPDHIQDVDDTLLSKTITCKHKGECDQECTGAFRIIKQELELCRRLGIPLPRLCPNCRHYERLRWRNLPRFFRRKCQCVGEASENGVYTNSVRHTHGTDPCSVEFETSYAHDRDEIVYCDKCYQAEIT